MSLQIWIAFVFAASIILIMPGPTIILVISQATSHGRKSVIPLVAGVLLGDFLAMALSLLGLGSLMIASSELFAAFKWIAAAYLIFIGIKQWLAKPEISQLSEAYKEKSALSLFRSSFLVTALNPKSIAFFVVFFPQFVKPSHSAFIQFSILGATFLSLAFINVTLYAVFAGELREKISSANTRKVFNRLGGSALIGAGIFTASMQRSS
ncbi:MAG: LysE family translocator [Lentisphaerae bacterium]|nr:LysE family translocator [Lentisphaerota bacterium]MCP4102425.1 LysE family translocator [Lentisphaerota bacterium]